jgi:hypothetical protein
MMNCRHRFLAALFAFTVVLFGCADREPDAGTAVKSSVTIVPVTDKWLGQWNGPEGTLLRLEGGRGKYEITIQDLDGARNYQGNATGDRIQFDRDGNIETIRATNGMETGMKWLSEKSNCLTIRPGEGYCRD